MSARRWRLGLGACLVAGVPMFGHCPIVRAEEEADASLGQASSGAAAAELQAANDPVVAAREQFLEGAQLSEQGRWAQAKQRYEASMALHPHATTLFNIAFCERELGELGSAWWKMKRSLEFGVGSDAALSSERRAHAERVIGEVEAQLAVVELQPTESPVRLSLKGRLLSSHANADGAYVVPTKEGATSVEQSGSFELVLEPGAHELSIETSSGVRQLNLDVVAGARSKLELGLPEHANAAVLAVEPTRPAPPQERARDPVTVLPNDSAAFSWKWAAFGAGVIGAGVGIGAGVNAYWMNEDLARDCPSATTCSEASRGDIEAMETSATVSDIGWIVALVGFGTGVVLWSLESDTDAPRASVAVSPGMAELHLRF